MCEKLNDKFLLENNFIFEKTTCYDIRWQNKLNSLKPIVLNQYKKKDLYLDAENSTLGEYIKDYGSYYFGISVEYDDNRNIRDKQYKKILSKNKSLKELNKLIQTLYYNNKKNIFLEQQGKSSRDFYCDKCDFEGINLKSTWVGWDITNSNLNNSNLSRIKTRTRGLDSGITIARVDSKECNDSRSDAPFDDCHVMAGVGKGSANFSNSSFVNTKLKGANLQYADLSNTIFRDSDLTNANLRFADLRNSIFINSKLHLVDFTGALLEGAHFEGNDYNKTIFSNTIKEGTTIDTNEFDKLAITLGCNPSKREKLDKCVKKIMKSQFNVDLNLDELKQNFLVMQNIQKKIEIINIAKNNNYNPNASKKNKPPEGYGEGKPEWKIDQSGRGYWDYGNGMGWMPPNQIYDDIISGFSLPNWQKDYIGIGSGGPVTVWDNGTVSKWFY